MNIYLNTETQMTPATKLRSSETGKQHLSLDKDNDLILLVAPQICEIIMSTLPNAVIIDITYLVEGGML